MQLAANDIQKTFSAGCVAGPLSFNVRAGEALCLFGPSGAGKTTVMRMLAGLETPTSGTIEHDGKLMLPITAHKPGTLGVVFQDSALWAHMSVRQHLHFVLKPMKIKKPKRNDQIDEYLSLLDLEHVAGHRPHLLSGGEKRRLSLARALITEPPLLLLDEPFTQLDSGRVERTIKLLREKRDAGATIVFTTHIENERDALATQIVTLNDNNTAA